MAMTKKDYDAIGAAFRSQIAQAQEMARGFTESSHSTVASRYAIHRMDMVARSIADHAQTTDKKFDRIRFLIGCGITE